MSLQALPSRTQARLQKYDDMLLNNERVARAESRRQLKRQRRSGGSAAAAAAAAATADDDSSDGSSVQSADTLSDSPEAVHHASVRLAREVCSCQILEPQEVDQHMQHLITEKRPSPCSDGSKASARRVNYQFKAPGRP